MRKKIRNHNLGKLAIRRNLYRAAKVEGLVLPAGTLSLNWLAARAQ